MDDTKTEMVEVLIEGLKEVLDAQDSDAVKIERMKRSERLWGLAAVLGLMGIIAATVLLIVSPHTPACTTVQIQGVVSAVCNK